MASGRVAVVGAGLAGLSAMLELKRGGWEVDVFERGRLIGGKATSFHLDGQEIDNGQHVHLGCCTAWLSFAAEVGMADALWTQPRFGALVLQRGQAPVRLRAGRGRAPLHLLGALMTYGRLPLADRLRLLRALAAARGRPLAPAPGSDGLSFGAWLTRRGQGASIRRAFWEPFLVPALNAPLDAVDVEAGLFVLRTAFLADAGACRIGFGRVPLARIAEAAASRADRVLLRTPVTGLDWDPLDGLRGIRTDRDGTLPYDGVVLAVPPRAAQRLLGDPARHGVHGLDRFRHEPIVDVHLWYESAPVDLDFAAIIESPIQWVFQKSPGYFCCSMSAARDLVGRSSEELVRLGHHELTAALPALRGSRLVRTGVTRDPEATFVPATGLRRPGAATSVPNLVLAGAWTDTGWPATMESAVRSGRAAARALQARAASSRVRPSTQPEVPLVV